MKKSHQRIPVSKLGKKEQTNKILLNQLAILADNSNPSSLGRVEHEPKSHEAAQFAGHPLISILNRFDH